MDQKNFDAVVIGAGPGGYVCAIKLGQLGVRTAMIEREAMGGVCLNVGCIPSKALIHAGNFYEKMIHHAPELGIQATVKGIDLKKLVGWKNGIVKKLAGGVETLLKANKVEILRGEAKFENPTTLIVKRAGEKSGGNAKGGIATRVSAKYFVIATGSRATVIPGFEPDGKNVLTSTEALDLSVPPKRLVVIGGGYIGLELGTYLAKVGSKVTVLEGLPRLLATMDKDCVGVVERGLKRRGVEIITEAAAKSWKKAKGALEVTYSVGGVNKAVVNKTVACDTILVTVGRKPNSDTLDLAKADIAPDSRGFVAVDRQLRTKIPHIFAIGDVAGGMLLAHKASKEGIVAAEVIAGAVTNSRALASSAFDTTIIPAVVFTDPEIASVGFTLEEARGNGFAEAHEGVFPFAALGKALSSGESEGFVKVVADKKTGRLLGCHIVGAEASSMLGEAGLALEMGATLEDLALTIHTHPTLPEALMEAAEVALGHPIHMVAKPVRTAEQTRNA
ncbi:MAG: dihydrolipoyl dehydrogenase [Deltaproteobacteria bacterium]|nr:dihydrolipoyl dehydrogenase [Deltaproteobacteria bacterium]